MDRNVPEMSMVTSPFGKIDGKHLNHFDVVRYAKTYDNGVPEWAKDDINTDYCAYDEGGRFMQLAYHQGRGYGLIKDEEGVPLCTLGVTNKDTPQMQRWFKALVKKAMLCHSDKIVSVQATHFDIPLQRFPVVDLDGNGIRIDWTDGCRTFLSLPFLEKECTGAEIVIFMEKWKKIYSGTVFYDVRSIMRDHPEAWEACCRLNDIRKLNGVLSEGPC